MESLNLSLLTTFFCYLKSMIPYFREEVSYMTAIDNMIQIGIYLDEEERDKFKIHLGLHKIKSMSKLIRTTIRLFIGEQEFSEQEMKIIGTLYSAADRLI